MGKIVRRTNNQIIRDCVKELVVESEEISLITLKTIFSRVKNVDQFKLVVDSLMDIVTTYIFEIEEGLLNPRQHYQYVVKGRLISSIIKTKSKLTLAGLSKRYRNKMKDFLVEDGNYFLGIKDRELKKLREDSELFYDDNDLKSYLFKLQKLEYFLELLPASSITKREASISIERLWKDSIRVQLKRGDNHYLKHQLKGEFTLDKWWLHKPFKKLDTDLQVKLFNDFSFSIKDGGVVVFDAINVKRLSSVDLVIDVDNEEFKEREQQLIDSDELGDKVFSLKLLDLREEFSR